MFRASVLSLSATHGLDPRYADEKHISSRLKHVYLKIIPELLLSWADHRGQLNWIWSGGWTVLMMDWRWTKYSFAHGSWFGLIALAG